MSEHSMCFKASNHLSIKKQYTATRKSLKINEWTISFSRSLNSFLTEGVFIDDTFRSKSFLSALENTPPKGFRFCYISFEKNGQFIGFMPCEIKHFKAEDSLNFSKETNPFLLGIRKSLAKHVSFETLVVGSLLLTGEHSYYFDNQLVTEVDKQFLILNGIAYAKKMLAEENISIKSTFIKDFFEPQNHFVTEGYNEFQVEPNFIFSIPETWKTFEDYMEALSSKYRVRTKRAFKKAEGVEKKEFNIERIIAHKNDINRLYKNVCLKSDFNLVELHEDYFVEMKRELEDKFKLWGYFTEGVLVGFFTTIDNGEELEAHFLGYDEKTNVTHHIYHNFLLDIIKIGIQSHKKRIVLARTAHEIKSSVGARAHEMYLYMKHEKPCVNSLLPYFLKVLSPRDVWQPRNPFK